MGVAASNGTVVDAQSDEITDAVQLFQQSARRANPEFNLARDRVYVEQICRQVDGAPLGIELAATWLKALSCEQIASELAQSLDFLSTSLRNVPPRHRSMRVVLDQTWHYLSSEEQQTFRRLSIFAGGCRAEAAEQVAEASLWMLASLVEKSVLQHTHDGRYRIHSLLRQLAAEKLASNPAELLSTQARHCDVYMTFLRARRRSIAGPEQRRVLVEIQDEMDNIRIAWTYASRHDRLGELNEALPALFRYLWTRGRYEDGERLMAQALEQLDGATLTDDQATVKIALTARKAQFVAALGGNQEALAMLDSALSAAQRIGSMPEQALCLLAIGTIADYLGDADRAVENLTAALSLYQQLSDDAGIAETSMVLGYAYLYLAGDYERGPQLVEEGLRIFRKLDDPSRTAEALDRTASIYWKLGRLDECEQCYQQCLSIARDIDNQFVIARGVGGLGLVAWSRGDLDQAIELMAERMVRMQELGNEVEVYTSVNLLCGIHAHAGSYAEAKELLGGYPGMRDTYWTAQIQVGAGAFAEAMRSLPQETAAMLAANNRHDLSSYLIAWAMLLMSDCALEIAKEASADKVLLADDDRVSRALEVVRLLRSYDECRADTRKRAQDLFAQWQSDEASLDDTIALGRRDRSIEEIAEDMLTIRSSAD